jgi:hypothetical protein
LTVSDSSGVTELLTRLPDATAGAAGGVMIAGSNAATTLASLTVTAATTLTGNVTHAGTTTYTGAVVHTDATTFTGAVTATNASNDVKGVFMAASGIVSGSFANGAITAASIANGAIDNATFAADVGSTAGATNIIALAVDKSLELLKVPKSDSNVTWNATALGSINAEIDTALNTEIPGSPTAGSVNERIVAIDAYGAPPATATIVDAVWDEVLHTDHETASSASVLLQAATAPTADAVADQVWNEVLSGHAGVGSAGAALSTASTGGVDAGVLAAAVWDDTLADHTTVGSTGKKLSSVGSSNLFISVP